MCDTENKCGCGCEKPENLETKPQECTPERIEQYHGDVKEHPCTEKEQ